MLKINTIYGFTDEGSPSKKIIGKEYRLFGILILQYNYFS